MPHFRLTLAYDGTDFAGSQIQPNQRTVQGELEDASVRSPRSPFGQRSRGERIAVSMRLARWCQWGCRHGATPQLIYCGRSTRACRATLVRPTLPSAASPSILGSTRFGAISLLDRFRPVGPFLGRYAWNRRLELDAEAVRAATGRLVGTHDFASFAGGGEGVPWSQRATKPKGTARTIPRCDCVKIQAADRPG